MDANWRFLLWYIIEIYDKVIWNYWTLEQKLDLGVEENLDIHVTAGRYEKLFTKFLSDIKPRISF